jgi:hypothetical protein
MNFTKSFYNDNELSNIGARKRLDVFCDNNKDFFYKIFYNIWAIKRNNLSGLLCILIYMLEDVKYYTKKYEKIFFDEKGGVSLFNFCKYYNLDVKTIENLLNKKYLTCSEYALLRDFVHEDEVNKYFEISKKYQNKKMIVDCNNIFKMQKGLSKKNIAFKQKYKNKSVVFTTEKDFENFEKIKKSCKILSI